MTARAATVAKGRNSALMATLKSVWALAIWRAGSAAVCATSPVKGWMKGKTSATPSTLKAMCAAATRRASDEERRLRAHAHQEKRQLLDLEGEELDGERRPDVGAEDHAQRLPEGDEPGRDEPDQHEGRRRGGLDEGRHDGARPHGRQPVAWHAREQVT